MGRPGDGIAADGRRYESISDRRRQARIVTHVDPSADIMQERNQLAQDLGRWMTRMNPMAYYLKFSPDHLKVISKLQESILNGGIFALAMPRGRGKTTMTIDAALWAIVNGHRQFVFAIAADQAKAIRLLDGIKNSLRYNDDLHAFYPEVTTYFRAAEGKGLKAAGQLDSDGNETGIVWSREKLVFPEISGSLCSGSVIQSAGLTGSIRGANHTLKSGRVIRPDFAVCDDPQTKESATSISQSTHRMEIIRGDVLGLSGPDKKIACVIPCTVIDEGDLASKLLDSKAMPECRGERMPMVYNWPDAAGRELWEKYKELYKDEFSEGDGHQGSTEFYKANRAAMDNGAVVAWEEAYNVKEEISALQNAYNKLIVMGQEAFDAECQNNPTKGKGELYEISIDIVASRCNGLPRGVAPDDAAFLTMFTDINYIGLNWGVMAHQSNGTAYLIDYGKHPEGRKRLVPDANKITECEIDGLIFEGLTQLHSIISRREYKRGKEAMKIDLALIDCGFRTKLVSDFCKRAQFPGLRVMPSRGYAETKYRQAGAVGTPGDGFHIADWKAGKVVSRVLAHNSDKWRMRAQKSFLQSPGGPGSLSLYGKDPKAHKVLAEEVCAEKLVDVVHGSVQTVYIWRTQPGSAWDKLDMVVGNLVAGAACGSGPRRGPVQRRKQFRGRVSAVR